MQDETATPEGAPVDAADGLESVISQLTAEQEEADAKAAAAPNEAEQPQDAQGESDEEPEAEEGDEAEQAEAEAETPDADAPQDPIYKVKVRGEEQDVPLSELLKGYSRTEDYKAKTAELARARETVEADVQRAYVEQLRRIESEFVALDSVLAEAAQIDWDVLARDDPAEYVAKSHEVQSRQRAIASVRAEIERHEKAAFDEEVNRERTALVAAKPELQAPKAFADYVSGLSDYLSSEGIPDDLLVQMTHHKLYLVAEKARKWDEAQKARATLPAKKAPPPVAAKPLRPAAQAPAPKPQPPKNASQREVLDWVASQL